jgi:uncharacterized protein (TIGR02172 family)
MDMGISLESQQKVGVGRTAEVFTYGEGKVVKLFYDWVQEDVVEHEFNISSLIYNSGVQTAKPYEIINHNGRLGIVYEQVLPGVTLVKMIGAQPWRLSKYAKWMAQLQYKLHATAVSEIPSYISGVKEALTSRINHTDLLEDAEKEQVLQQLNKLPAETSLCHLDFHPDNILMGKEEKPYIIDWTTCGVGSPLADVARTILMLQYGTTPTQKSKLVAMVSSFAGKKLRQAYEKEYMRLSGCTKGEIERWLVPIAAARLVEGIPDSEKEALVLLIKKGLGQ